MTEPAPDDLLPPNVCAMGSPVPLADTPSIRLPVNCSANIAQSNFPRAAQSALLLHRALVWENKHQQEPYPVIDVPDSSMKPPDPGTETGHVQVPADFVILGHAIRVQIEAMLEQDPGWASFCDCFAMCIAALFAMFRSSIPRVAANHVAVPSALYADKSRTVPLITGSQKYQEALRLMQNCHTTALSVLSFAVGFMADMAKSFNQADEHRTERQAMLAPAMALTSGYSVEILLKTNGVLPDAVDNLRELWQALDAFQARWLIGSMCFLHSRAHVWVLTNLVLLEGEFWQRPER
jgi:hypothetical protein